MVLDAFPFRERDGCCFFFVWLFTHQKTILYVISLSGILLLNVVVVLYTFLFLVPRMFIIIYEILCVWVSICVCVSAEKSNEHK